MHYAERPLPIRTLGNVVVALLAAALAAGALGIVTQVAHYEILADLDRGEDLSFETVDDSDTLVIGINALQALSQLAVGVLLIVWLFRAYKNLQRLGVWRLRYDPGWVVGAWFIPFFNLWRPKQILNDVWRGSEPAPGPRRLEDHPRVGAVVHLWWAGWVLVSTLVGVDLIVTEWAYTLPGQKDATIFAIVTDAVWIVAAALAMAGVWQMTRRQTKAIEQWVPTAPPTPQHGWGQPLPAPGWSHPQPGWGAPAPQGWGQPPPAPQAWGQPQVQWGQPAPPPPAPEDPAR
jgi:hypothetical protein